MQRSSSPHFVGMRFGSLVVLKLSHRNARGEVFWRCRCDCGRDVTTRAGHLRSGNTQSCGCARLAAVTTHGMTGTRTFKSWETMKQRCLNPNASDYPRFGGRGIKVCAAWVNDFGRFLSDMGERPPGKTLDRIDVNGNYTPKNCRWSTPKEQMRNRRNTRYVIVRGKKRPLITLAEEHGIKLGILVARLGSGWPLQKALSEPIMQGRGKKADPP